MMSEQINELASALAKAQGKIQPAIKNCHNPYFNSWYADLASCKEASKEALEQNGLSIATQGIQKDGKEYFRTMLMHSSGQFIQSDIPVYNKKGDNHGYLAAQTYARRAGHCGLVGVVGDDDDDGNINSNNQKKTQTPEPCKEFQEIHKLVTATKENRELVTKELHGQIEWRHDNRDSKYWLSILAIVKGVLNVE